MRGKAVDPEIRQRGGIHTDYFWFDALPRIPANQESQAQQFIL
jgi:hypothetical protein